MKKVKYQAIYAICIVVYIATIFSIVQYHKSFAKYDEIVNTQQEQIERWKHLYEETDMRNDLLEQEVERLSTIKAKVTAYAPSDNKSGICADGNPKVTATGTQAKRGIIAVDPSKIPYFTKIEIPGYGIASAEDTGGAIRNYDGVAIDILVDSYEEAMQWGVRYLDVKIKQTNKS